jgi:hypothetical protein
MKTATIQQVHSVRQWDGPNGTLFFHKLTFDNGDQGDLGKKERDAVKAGDSLTYTLEADSRGNRIKEVKPQAFQSGIRQQRSQGSTASFALSYAKDLAVANVAKSDKPLEMDKLADKIIATAEKFNEWFKANS